MAGDAGHDLGVLRDWVDSGATFGVLVLTPEHAVLDLRACTGESVDRLESSDPELIAALSSPGSELGTER